MIDAKEKIILALDKPTLDEAVDTAVLLKDYVGAYKIGLELFTSEGPKALKTIAEKTGKKVFFDSKMMDIPNTVRGAAAAATRLGVWMFNVHTLGGEDMLKAAVEAVHETAEKENKPRPLVIGVTLLTSINESVMRNQLRIGGSVTWQVVFLAKMAQAAGLDGVVASPYEAEGIREACGDDFLIITPGVRPRGKNVDDQKRVTTPAIAIENGADYLVVGRAITQDSDPVTATQRIIWEIEQTLADA